MGEIGICNRIENRNGQCCNEELTHFNNEAQRVETTNDSCVRQTELRTGYGTLDTIHIPFLHQSLVVRHVEKSHRDYHREVANRIKWLYRLRV